MWFKKKKPSETDQAKINPPPPVKKTAAQHFIETLGYATDVNQILYATASLMHKHGPVKITTDGQSWSNKANDFLTRYEVTFADGSSVTVKLP